MKNIPWTITIATVRGIPIRLHITFLVFVFAMVIPSASSSLYAAAFELLFLIGIFASIALHELGHAFAASRYNIETRDIVLYPFGGIASITKMPEARGELVIALAGPLVNVIIAFCLYFLIDFSTFLLIPSLIANIFIANIVLFLFNLIPAIPMDGGRVLRALLVIGKVPNATIIASRISQLISILFALIAIYFGRMDLLLVAAVVFIGSVQEQVQGRTMRAAIGRTVGDAMIGADRLQAFSHATTVRDGLLIALRSLQEFFPVLLGNQIKGIVAKDELVQFAAAHEENAYLQEILNKDFVSVEIDTPLEALIKPGGDGQARDYFIVVDKSGGFVGMLLREKIIELLVIDELNKRMDNERTLDESSRI